MTSEKLAMAKAIMSNSRDEITRLDGELERMNRSLGKAFVASMSENAPVKWVGVERIEAHLNTLRRLEASRDRFQAKWLAARQILEAGEPILTR